MGLNNKLINEMLDMYESSSEMYSGAVIRVDLSNDQILYSSNFKQIVGLGKNELPKNLEELERLLGKDFKKLSDKFYNEDYETIWTLKINLKKEVNNTFELVGKKKRKDNNDIIYLLIRNLNQHYGIMSPETFFPKDLFDNSPQAIVITDKNNKVLRVNKAFTDILGYSAEEIIGKEPHFWASSMHDKSFYEEMWYELKTKGFWSGKIIDKRKNGEVVFLYSNIFEIKGNGGKLIGYIAINSDITNNIKKEQEIEKIIRHDSITGLPNSKYLFEKLENVFYKDNEDKQYALMIIKIEEFNELSVIYGFKNSNVILREISKRILDVVEKEYFVSRVSEDEFTVFGCFDTAEDLEEIAEKLKNEVKKNIKILGENINLKVNIGISIYPKDTSKPNDLLNLARMALKRATNNSITFYSGDLSNILIIEKNIEKEVYKAIEDDRLLIHLQPQIDTRDYKIIGAEALVRLHKKDGNILTPAAFLDIAKKKGFIENIDKHIFLKTSKLINEVKNALDEKLRIYFNISRDSFERKDIISKIEKILRHFDIDASYLGIELTEDIFIDDFYEAKKKIHALKEVGLKIALDDFGTGFSSLSYLNKLEIDKIKIDKSFIDDILENDASKRLVSSIISMSNDLGLEVIAEGVENESQLQFLNDKGCHEVQGYYFSKPLPIKEFKEYLKLKKVAIGEKNGFTN